jgi:hypothetical protein
MSSLRALVAYPLTQAERPCESPFLVTCIQTHTEANKPAPMAMLPYSLTTIRSMRSRSMRLTLLRMGQVTRWLKG